MPFLTDDYKPVLPWFRNGHWSTIYPNKLRRIRLNIPVIHHRIELPDGDFIDIDQYNQGNSRTAILVHGMEGDAHRPYMYGMIRSLNKNGWDVSAMNLRGCSGEPNRLDRAYHAGDIRDLEQVVSFVREQQVYKMVAIIGFSLGGNIVLNYLARSDDLPEEVKRGAAISTPVDLRHTVKRIMEYKNRIYHYNFYIRLKQKIRAKQKKYPDLLPYEEILRFRNIDEFDEIYTARYHGFRNAEEYRIKSSVLPYLKDLKRPALLINAKNDSFLTDSCYPKTLAESSEFLHLMMPRYGGHCGFWAPGGVYFHEKKVVEFLESI